MNTFFWVPLLAAASLPVWYLYWQSHARHFKTSGYTSPNTSWFGKFAFSAISKLVNFLTVGPVTVKGKHNVPKGCRVLIVGNHQVPSDFAVARRAFGRHFRALGAAAQFPGFQAVLAAWLGIIPVTYETREDRSCAEAACVSYLSSSYPWMQVILGVAFAAMVLMLALSVVSIWLGSSLLYLFPVFMLCVLLSTPGPNPALLIAPQGALLPDNILAKEEFRPGAVRISRSASLLAGDTAWILPMAVYYERDAKYAHWTHRFLKKPRSMFLGMRNPIYWDPLFKVNLDVLDEAERSRVVRAREAAMDAYKHSHITSYGCTIVVGEPIDPFGLAANPVDAIEEIRLQIVELLSEAQKH